MKYIIYVLVAINIAFLLGIFYQTHLENKALKGFIKNNVETRSSSDGGVMAVYLSAKS